MEILNIIFIFDNAKGEKDMTFFEYDIFESISELSYLAIKCAYMLIV